MPDSPQKPVLWRLSSGADRRFRLGHPWVYSNELAESPKGIEPGAPIELRDSTGKFLARGYGNPSSLIAFRTLSRDPSRETPWSSEALLEALLRAAELREALGLGKVSHRLCFGEADRLPGLVIDRYLSHYGQVFAVQAHTAGANRWIPGIADVLRKLVERVPGGPSWDETSIVIRNDLGVRKLEGLQEEEPRVLKEGTGFTPHAGIRVASASGGDPLVFETDLLQGQKTGFFLDQSANIQLAIQKLSHLKSKGEKVRILDLCSYVGQWGAQLARAFGRNGVELDSLAVDASEKALSFAKKNVESAGGRCEVLRGDVLKDLEKLDPEKFDIVISDPPALIKGRKDLPAGKHAYLQLNTQVFRLVKKGGMVVSCSCSGLLPEDDFIQILSKAAYRNRAGVRWVGRGSQGGDHPVLAEFPEGRYLKGWVGWVEGSEGKNAENRG